MYTCEDKIRSILDVKNNMGKKTPQNVQDL